MFKRLINQLILLCLLGLLGLVPVQANTITEPNDTCETAQDFSSASLPISLSGEFTSTDEIQDYDFLKFKGTPGTLIKIDLAGKSDKPNPDTGLDTLYTLFSVWDSGCQTEDGLKYPRLLGTEVVKVPENGLFIVQTGTLFQGEQGDYTLTLAKTDAAGSITGQVIDSITQKQVILPGLEIELYRCNNAECIDPPVHTDYQRPVAIQIPDDQGKFSFAQEGDGTPLSVGSYKIVPNMWNVTGPMEYQSLDTPPFSMATGQSKTVNVLLKSYPARVSIKPCNNIPTTGGTCKFSVTITNGQAKPLSATVWGMVRGDLINTLFQGTQFPIVSFPFINLPKAGSKTLDFQFKVPAVVRDGAFFCTTIYVGGLGRDPQFDIKGQGDFCIGKLPNSKNLTIVPNNRVFKSLQKLNTAPSLKTLR